MRESLKRAFKISAIVILVFLGGYVALTGFAYLSFQIRAHAGRYVDCDPNGLLADLKMASEVNFPEDIQEVKAAKSPPIEGSILFIVKFTSKPDVLNSFIESFPKDPFEIELEPYKPESDLRRKSGSWVSPPWFTEAIENGKMGVLLLGNRTADIYIDETNEKHSVVYITGSYSKCAAEKSN